MDADADADSYSGNASMHLSEYSKRPPKENLIR